MYEPTRQLMSFHIAGFQHYDGALALRSLEAGMALELEAEPDNPYDAEAVKLSLRGSKLGYVPASLNSQLSTLLFYGHARAFEARVLQVDPTAAPWKQVYVGIFATDRRKHRR